MKNDIEIFKTLFGASPESIKETCIVTPFYSKETLEGLKIPEVSRGLLYSCGNNDSISVIITKMGAGFVGDAVLYLKNTKCKNLIFFGACGALNQTFKIGDMALIEKAYSQDSFANMLLKRKLSDTFYPDSALFKKLLPYVTKTNCLSVGSLKLEEEYLETLKNMPVDVIDMETSVFLLASTHIKKKAAALLYITDILKVNPYYNTFKKDNLQNLKNITANCAKNLFELIKLV